MVLGEAALDGGEGAGRQRRSSRQSTAPFSADLDVAAATLSAGPLVSAYDASLSLTLDEEGLRVDRSQGEAVRRRRDRPVRAEEQRRHRPVLRPDAACGRRSGAGAAEVRPVAARAISRRRCRPAASRSAALVAALSGSGTAALRGAGASTGVNPRCAAGVHRQGRCDRPRHRRGQDGGLRAGDRGGGPFRGRAAPRLAFTVAGGVLRAPPVTLDNAAATMTADVQRRSQHGHCRVPTGRSPTSRATRRWSARSRRCASASTDRSARRRTRLRQRAAGAVPDAARAGEASRRASRRCRRRCWRSSGCAARCATTRRCRPNATASPRNAAQGGGGAAAGRGRSARQGRGGGTAQAEGRGGGRRRPPKSRHGAQAEAEAKARGRRPRRRRGRGGSQARQDEEEARTAARTRERQAARRKPRPRVGAGQRPARSRTTRPPEPIDGASSSRSGSTSLSRSTDRSRPVATVKFHGVAARRLAPVRRRSRTKIRSAEDRLASRGRAASISATSAARAIGRARGDGDQFVEEGLFERIAGAVAADRHRALADQAHAVPSRPCGSSRWPSTKAGRLFGCDAVAQLFGLGAAVQGAVLARRRRSLRRRAPCACGRGGD